MASKLTFEILCIDSQEQSFALNEEQLLYRILGNGKLWKKPHLKKDEISDSELSISLRTKLVDSNKDEVDTAFLVKVEGGLENISEFRLPLIKFLKDENFDTIYILTDEVSKEFSEKIYPLVNKLENLLRKYLTLYFSTKFGPRWWHLTADTEVRKKANLRINNETVFSQPISKHDKRPLVDLNAYLIDFDDLGDMIYKKSAGNLTREDIILQLENLKDDNDLKRFQSNIKNNIQRFFQEFSNIDFQTKWEYLKGIRNKVAHNSLFTEDDYSISKKYADELIPFLSSACDKIAEIKISPADIETIKNSIVKASPIYTFIDRNTLLKELHKTNDWSNKSNRKFIGLKNFASNILGQKGFDIPHTYDILNELKSEQIIDIYEYKDDSGGYAPLPAIKVLKELTNFIDQN